MSLYIWLVTVVRSAALLHLYQETELVFKSGGQLFDQDG